MAVPAAARKTIVVYDGGSIQAPLGVISLLFPTSQLKWRRPSGFSLSGRKRKYGSRQRSNNAAGEAFKVRFKNGDTWTMRVTGKHQRFIEEILETSAGDNVVQIYSERGTIYGPQYIDE